MFLRKSDIFPCTTWVKRFNTRKSNDFY